MTEINNKNKEGKFIISARTKKLIFITLFLLVNIGIEFVYRQPLYDYSLTFARDWQSKSSYETQDFFEFVSNLGTLPAFLPIFIILYLWWPITISFTFILNFVYCSFLMNLMKIIYSDPRPYWIDVNVFKKCSPGFGNPSGHAVDSMGVYLSLWHILTDNPFFIKNRILKYIILLTFLVLIILIIISRVFLGVHSINQIVYGSCIGFVIYYLIFNVLEVQKSTPNNFFEFFKLPKNTTLMSMIFMLSIGSMLVVYFLRNVETAEWNEKINKNCPDLIDNNRYKNDALVKGMIYCLLIGSHYGLLFLSKIIDKLYKDKFDEINNWNQVTLKNNFYKVLIAAILSSPAIAYFLVSEKSTMWTVLMFKIFFPLLIAMFNIYGPAIIICIKYKIANRYIYLSNVPQMSHKKIMSTLELKREDTYFK